MKNHRAKALFERHHAAVYGFVLRSCADLSLAEDLTQEVFLRALASRSAPPPVTGERPWLLRIARNLLIDRWRRLERVPADIPLRPSCEPALPNERHGLRSDLQRALSSLPAGEQEAFLLRELGGLSYAEIGKLTGATDAAIRSRIYRARQQLRSALGSEEDWQDER